MNQFEKAKQELKKRTRGNIKFDQAILGIYAAAFLGVVGGGIAGTIKFVAEDPKDINGYMWLPALLLVYYVFVVGNLAIGGINPKLPEEHINKYKQELKKLYNSQQTSKLR